MDDAVPHVEWWDVQYLPKAKRLVAAPGTKGGAALKVTINAGPVAAPDASYSDAAVGNSRFHTLVVHPVPVKPVGADKVKVPELPVYLTKKEAKRIRRQVKPSRAPAAPSHPPTSHPHPTPHPPPPKHPPSPRRPPPIPPSADPEREGGGEER